MADTLSVIRALVNAQTNDTTVTKEIRDEDNDYRRGLQSTATTVLNDARQANDMLKKSDEAVNKIWSGTRKRIQASAITVMGNLAALSYPIGVPFINGNKDGQLLDQWSNVGNQGNFRDYQFNPSPRIHSFERSRSSLAETIKVAQESPYTTLMNSAIKLVEVNRVLGFIVVGAVYALTLTAMDQLARNDSDSYIAQASNGRSALAALQYQLRRSVNPNSNNLGYRDPDVWRNLFNGQVSSQYDGEPLAQNSASHQSRYLQDGI